MVGKLICCLSISAVLVATPAVAETVKIGVIMGLSGPPTIVDFGESWMQGVETAVREYKESGGKHQIELITYNDEAKPERAVALAQRLISNDKVSIALGTVNSGNAAAFAPLFQEAKIPVLVGPAIATNIVEQFKHEKPSYVFRCSLVEKFQVEKLLDWTTTNFKKVGLLHATSGYGIFAAGEVRNGLKARGYDLVAVEAVAPNVTDYSPQLLKLREAGAEIVLNFTDTYELFYRAATKINWKPATAGNWGLASQMLFKVVGEKAIEGTSMVVPVDTRAERVTAFNDKLQKHYGSKFRWPPVAVLGYDSARLALAAIDKAGVKPADIRDALEKIDDFQAISGAPKQPFTAENHECLSPETIFLGQWKNGSVVTISN
ncbi:Peripla_BP_6 domain-containing protein [Hyphomicrobiales bacterium]|nr:Peripla_BP_6 domain-containing protein [Hyphomicrobiales bacterium]CAH1691860.1 Peripla_BP_6 domain-containing protein [Hyphomicrobiales bacterium]